ncbi:MAG TPA: RHS repeat-associated core domain-containing protein [Clostridia bacterium]|nr:RHS repeat-associated core domain-containing protein [Clostridia bacterium]
MSTVWRFDNLVSSNYTEYLSGLTTEEQEAEEYPVAITDEGSRTRRYDYDSLGRLCRATDLSGTIWWTNEFNPTNGALIAVISPTGETNAYTYDDLDNVKTIQFSDGNYLTNFYNQENRLSGVRLPSGALLTNFYDFAGRLTNRTGKVNGVIAEIAHFEYNLNDAVTVMTDNTGSTTNFYDAAGRLWGIDYPSGASVRYELDLLNRITAITNKASLGGIAYVTRYQYDPIGNITNITDPLKGQTRLEYDRVGRRTKRTLPNNVVSEWQYDWRDRVTNVTHKTSGGNTLASFTYWRNPGGEPWKIMREGGNNYVLLQHDTALRLTNEVYYTNGVNGSGGSVEEQISYGHDASGSRIRLVKGGLAYTNIVGNGYQITQVKTNGVLAENYSYDTGGRVTQISRDGTTLVLAYNTSDQVAAATNGLNWVTYTHDASGRRTFSTNHAGQVRKFLVAPTPGTDLESPQLIASAGGAFQKGYVYLGHYPLLRFDGASNAVYYLEDGMGSVAALVDSEQALLASFNYDGFGNVRSQSGETEPPGDTGGDFRFHGAWLEEASGLYNMRTREYDGRMGRFTSRDSVGGDFKAAETLNAYVFVINNPHIAVDPSGEFSLIELNIVSAEQFTLATLKTAATQYAKARARREIGSAFSSFVGSQIMGFLGFDWANAISRITREATDGFDMGTLFGEKGQQVLCKTLGKIDGMEDQIHTHVRVSAAPSRFGPIGTPLTRGRDCNDEPGLPKSTGWSVGIPYGIPDFIIGDKPIASVKPRSFNQALLVGDFKWSAKALHDDYAAKQPRKPEQYAAVIGYAKRHTLMHVGLFIVGHNKSTLPGGKASKTEMTRIKTMMGKTLVKQQVLPVVLIVAE